MNHSQLPKNSDIYKEGEEDTKLIIKIIENNNLSKKDATRLKNIHINNMLGYRGGDMKYEKELEQRINDTIFQTNKNCFQKNQSEIILLTILIISIILLILSQI